MPVKHIKHAIKAGSKHGPFFVPMVMLMIVFSLAFFCASASYLYRLLFKSRRRTRRDVSRQRYLPVGLRDDEDDEIGEGDHIWDPEEVRLVQQQRSVVEKEKQLSKKVDRMKKQLDKYETELNTAREAQVQLTARLNTSRQESRRENEILADADRKGRHMYGDEAWDKGIDGGPPLKMLLSLEKEEIEYVKQGVLTARREEAKRLHSSRRERNVSPRDANEESSHVYGVNDVTLNMKYENEIGDNYVGHTDTLLNARNLTERLRWHNSRNGADQERHRGKKKKRNKRRGKRTKDV